MSPLKHCLVIKLSIVGQPQLLPAFAQAGKRCVGGNLQFRPSINFTCPQCYSREQLKQRAVRDLEVFNPIKAIKLGPPRCYLRQIPALGRRRASYASCTVLQTLSRQRPVDRSNPRRAIRHLIPERPLDRTGAIFAQDVLFTQRASQLGNTLLKRYRQAVPASLAARSAIGEIYPVQPVAFSAGYPQSDRVHARMELLRYHMQAVARTHQTHHLSMYSLNALFLAMTAPYKKPKTYFNCSAIAETPVFRDR